MLIESAMKGPFMENKTATLLMHEPDLYRRHADQSDFSKQLTLKFKGVIAELARAVAARRI